MSEPAIGELDQRPGRAPGFDMDTLVGYILLVGVLSSILLLVFGTAWNWLQTGSLQMDFQIQGMNLFQFAAASLERLIEGPVRPRTLIELGISTLLLTPYIRVLASMLYFLLAERNWKYSLFTLFVLCVLTYALFLS
jgi:uncharacterized membrane protein